jgi:hypothetical protein
VRWAAASRRLVPATVALVVMFAASACGGSRSSTATPPPGLPAAAARLPSPRLASGALVVTTHAAAGPVSADSRHLVWESGPIESETLSPSIHDRNLATGSTRTFPGTVNPLWGLASTSRFVFYARTSGNSVSVVRASHEGTHPRVLTRALVTPIASRGNVVAWGEESGPVLRVVAYGGAGEGRWVVARMRRCTTAGCYRIGDVTVARQGIVFTRDAVGSQRSFVMRRAFGEQGIQSIPIQDDPQPDLVPSSSGALYYVLLRGWYRWDFGSASPRPVAFANKPPKQLIAHEGSLWYWVVRHDCSVRLESTRGGNGAALNVPARMANLGPDAGRTCTELGALAFAGAHAIASWAIASELAEESHNDTGLRGAVLSARISPS